MKEQEVTFMLSRWRKWGHFEVSLTFGVGSCPPTFIWQFHKMSLKHAAVQFGIIKNQLKKLKCKKKIKINLMEMQKSQKARKYVDELIKGARICMLPIEILTYRGCVWGVQKGAMKVTIMAVEWKWQLWGQTYAKHDDVVLRQSWRLQNINPFSCTFLQFLYICTLYIYELLCQ